jgi:transposase-like protein
MGKYRTYDAELKARVVLEALQGQKTAAQICRENGIADDLYLSTEKGTI